MDRILLQKEIKDKIHELQSKLITTKEVLKHQVFILEDLEKMTGVSAESLEDDVFNVFGNVMVKCGSCGELVASERQICPHCMSFVDVRDAQITA